MSQRQLTPAELLTELLIHTDAPSFFKEMLVRDISEIESNLQNLKILYGVDVKLTIQPIEKPEGRWLGKGVVEQMATIADLYKKPSTTR